MLASQDSIVLVRMTQEVSPRCEHLDLVVFYRLHEVLSGFYRGFAGVLTGFCWGFVGVLLG